MVRFKTWHLCNTVLYDRVTLCDFKKIEVQFFSIKFVRQSFSNCTMLYDRNVPYVIIKPILWTSSNLISLSNRRYECDIRCVIQQMVNIEYPIVRAFGRNSFEKNNGQFLCRRIGSQFFQNGLDSNSRVPCSSLIRCWINDSHCKLCEDHRSFKANHLTSFPFYIHLKYPRIDKVHHKPLSSQKSSSSCRPQSFSITGIIHFQFLSVIICSRNGSWGTKRGKSKTRSHNAHIVCEVLHYHWVLSVFQCWVLEHKGFSAMGSSAAVAVLTEKSQPRASEQSWPGFLWMRRGPVVATALY